MFNLTADQLRNIADQYNSQTTIDKIGDIIIRRANNGKYDYLTDVVGTRREVRDIKRFFEFRGIEVTYSDNGIQDNNGSEVYSMYFRW